MSDVADARVDWRDWAPGLVAGAVVLLLGLFEAATTDYFVGSRIGFAWVAVATAVAVGLCLRLPGAALGVVWASCGLQVLSDLPLMYVQAAIAMVAFSTARWGSTPTVVASALSIPAAGFLAVFVVGLDSYYLVGDSTQVRRLLDVVQQFSATWQVAAAVVGTAVLGAPWLAGLTLRFSSRAAASRASQVVAEEEAARAHRESEQAQEIARLREEQAQLARDVHDVVGHSLAVILAQAESAQFLDEADTAALRLSMRNIADSARGSLQDVRSVLTSTQDPTSGPGELHDLIEGVRASGHELRVDEIGLPRPLAPELATVAYRVLQEMLTNAIRHGRRDAPVAVELHWGGDLRIEVANAVGETADGSVDDSGPERGPQTGQGLAGMRRRLESIGGRLDVRRRDTDGRETFTATAWVPTRTVSP